MSDDQISYLVMAGICWMFGAGVFWIHAKENLDYYRRYGSSEWQRENVKLYALRMVLSPVWPLVYLFWALRWVYRKLARFHRTLTKGEL